MWKWLKKFVHGITPVHRVMYCSWQVEEVLNYQFWTESHGHVPLIYWDMKGRMTRSGFTGGMLGMGRPLEPLTEKIDSIPAPLSFKALSVKNFDEDTVRAETSFAGLDFHWDLYQRHRATENVQKTCRITADIQAKSDLTFRYLYLRRCSEYRKLQSGAVSLGCGGIGEDQSCEKTSSLNAEFIRDTWVCGETRVPCLQESAEFPSSPDRQSWPWTIKTRSFLSCRIPKYVISHTGTS